MEKTFDFYTLIIGILILKPAIRFSDVIQSLVMHKIIYTLDVFFVIICYCSDVSTSVLQVNRSWWHELLVEIVFLLF